LEEVRQKVEGGEIENEEKEIENSDNQFSYTVAAIKMKENLVVVL